MEKHRCKLCFKSFSHGRALGGHMRSHMLNRYVPPKPEKLREEETEAATESASFEGEENHEEKGYSFFSYGLRENPRKSIRVVDPEFSFGVDSGSVVLQDRESETELSKNPIQIRKSTDSDGDRLCYSHGKKPKIGAGTIAESSSWVIEQPEPVRSSISDTTTEEDVAYCLMMLSRDKWNRTYEEEINNDHSEDDSNVAQVSKARPRGKYKCETCNKGFRSYQALGGHRASHKKIKPSNKKNSFVPGKDFSMVETQNARGRGSTMVVEEKIHECPICYKVFSSGQALGGHKRSHGVASANLRTSTTILTPAKPLSSRFGEILIDLNLPAPNDDYVCWH